MSNVSKLTADKHQRILLDLASKPGNDVCADCKARAPRWASHNLGIFICMNCASIHRKIGTHITKVKSVTMDSWSREQVEVMKSIGNVASNANYNPNETRHPPPANREESERDSELEKFIRWKYEFKRFIDKSASQVATSSSKALPPRAQSMPVTTVALKSSPLPPLPASQTPDRPAPTGAPETRPYSVSTAPTPSAPPVVSLTSPPTPIPPQLAARTNLSHPVWEDMMSLSASSMSQSQLQPPQPQSYQPTFVPTGNSTNPFKAPSLNPFPSNSVNYTPSRPAGFPVLSSPGPAFQTQSLQPSVTNPFGVPQQPSAFSSQTNSASLPIHSVPTNVIQVPSPYGSPGSSSFSHLYTPPSSFPQQQQQPFLLSSFPQQLIQPSPSPAPASQPGFPQRPASQGENGVSAPMQWQQRQTLFPGQPQYRQWGAM